MRIAMIGSGYVGLVAGACFAELGHDVILVDNDPAKFISLERGEVPIYEAHLCELFRRHRGARLTIANDTVAAVRESAVVFVAVGTPPRQNGEADLCYVENVARDVAAGINGYKVIVSKSTVPVYTSEWVRRVMLLNGAPANLFDVVSNPEFLREGTAVTDFLYPDRIVIGAETQAAAALVAKLYAPLLDGSYAGCAEAIPAPPQARVPARIIFTTARSAELIKHASNTFLALKVSFINAVANLCECVGGDIEDVRMGIGADKRIGEAFLGPGIGYGGSCFPKDLSAFHAVARECGYDFALIEEVSRINESQRSRFLRKVRSVLWTLRGKRLAVLGLAFKGGTDDIRESPAIAIIQALLAEGAQIAAYDPAAMRNASEPLPPGVVEYCESPYEAARSAHALLVLTDWNEFRELDLPRIRALLRYPIVVDGRNLFDRETMQELHFTYLSVGRPDVAPTPQLLAAESRGKQRVVAAR